MSQTYRLHARPAAVSRAPTLSENFESGPSRRCRVPRDSTSSEEQMEIDAFWRGGARLALRPDGGRNLFQKKYDSLLPVSACARRPDLPWQGRPTQAQAPGASWPTPRPVWGWAEAAGPSWARPTPRPVTGWAQPGGIGPPLAQSRAGLRLGDWPTPCPVMGWAQAVGAAWGWPTPAYPAHMSATPGTYLSFSPDFLA
jgi:hypothetical protein